MTDGGTVCEDLRAALPALPLFPLGGCVLFPHTLLPLHIFEDRYREMTRFALETHRMIGIVQCNRDEDLAEVAGVGRIVHHEELDDGRFHILLQGLARVRVGDELPREGMQFRRARVEVITDSTEGEIAPAMVSLRACYEQLAHRAPDAQGLLGDLPRRIDDPAVLADVVCAAALADPDLRQTALAERCVARRLRMGTEALADLLLAEAPREDVVH